MYNNIEFRKRLKQGMMIGAMFQQWEQEINWLNDKPKQFCNTPVDQIYDSG